MLFLFFLFQIVSAVRFGIYSNADCSDLLAPVYAFTDVCSWATYSTSYAPSHSLYLQNCTNEQVYVMSFSLKGGWSCEPKEQNYSFPVSSVCQPAYDFYTKLIDASTCEGADIAYNVAAHTASDCSNDGPPFTLVYDNKQCVDNSFAPNYHPGSWDTRIFQADSTFHMEVFQSDDGTCQTPLYEFETNEFRGQCLHPVNGYPNTTFLQIWHSFPIKNA